MSKDLLTEHNISEIHQTIEKADGKYLCFTTFDLQWTFCVTDGIDVWRLVVDEDDFNTHRDLSDIATDEAFCGKIRTGFISGDLSVARIGTKLKLDVGKGSSAISFDLYEATAANKRVDFKNVLFRLAESTTKLEAKLRTASQRIDKLELEKSANKGTNSLFDTSSKRGTSSAAAKNKPKKVGMSVVNPTSKKRKAATGVVFD